MLASRLKITQDKLEVAQRAGIKAEKLLLQAEQQGEREAALYTKALAANKKASATSATTTTSSTNINSASKAAAAVVTTSSK